MEELAGLFGDTVVVHLQADSISGAVNGNATDAGGDGSQKLYTLEHEENTDV